MKISFIKMLEDNNSYKLAKKLGMPVFEIDQAEQIDNKIEELKDMQYKTIIIPNELASFSENIIQKYKNDNKINIIITPSKDV